ncbi:hypothetical protein RJ639_038610 [Escallonia herrerae]|uniref:HMA domain-containing protein n=1 Tax=Escallonia herrerae TaxID=1293975 RepID=A0AA88WKX3_9ASTE|nr:hypothetical protein RJ639_038610 [Escallonia herrerae]
MKTIELFCASPASTAICSSMDQRAMVRHGMQPIDHCIIDHHRRKIRTPIPCSSRPPIDPKPYYQKSRKSCAKQSEVTRKSSAGKNDLTSPSGSSRYLLSDKPSEVNRKSLADKYDLTSPLGSSRYLLSDKPFVEEMLSDPDHVVSALVASQTPRTRRVSSSSNDSPILKSSSTPSRARGHQDNWEDDVRDNMCLSAFVDDSKFCFLNIYFHLALQVVELRVSIHCKGCEGKVRKHISRMEGKFNTNIITCVTSFSIDLATKKVIIIGDISPLSVLTSVSRVKNAQFWLSSPSSSSPSSPVVGVSY